MTVPVFEEQIRQGLLQEKFRKLVTDGISIGPGDLQQEFRYKNEKVKLDYALIKPEDLEAKISPDEAEIKAAYEKNEGKYHGAGKACRSIRARRCQSAPAEHSSL